MPDIPARVVARWLFDQAVNAVNPSGAVHKFVQRSGDVLTVGEYSFDLKSYRRVILVGAGKASGCMAVEFAPFLDGHLSDSLICTKYGHSPVDTRGVTVIEAAHPVPDKSSESAATRMIDLVSSATHEDIVFCMISGGASALVAGPAAPLTLSDKQAVTSAMLAAGLPIHSVNLVRKHLSTIKGGRLALAAAPAQVVSVILSDVPGDDPRVIASGATVPDADGSTLEAALHVLNEADVLARVSPDVAQRVLAALASPSNETPKAASFAAGALCGPISAQATEPALPPQPISILIGSSKLAVEAVVGSARALGLPSVALTHVAAGEAAPLGALYASIATSAASVGMPLAPPCVIVSAGEPTVQLPPGCDGIGGRSQELAAEAAAQLPQLAVACDVVRIGASARECDAVARPVPGSDNESIRAVAAMAADHAKVPLWCSRSRERIAVLAGGSDGSDGPNDATGAVADASTRDVIVATGDDFGRRIARHDVYTMWRRVDTVLAGSGPPEEGCADGYSATIETISHREHNVPLASSGTYHIVTGPTQTNVMDIHIVVVLPSAPTPTDHAAL